MSMPQDQMQAGMQAALDKGQESAGKTPEEQAASEQEYNAVKKLWKEYETARTFDKAARSQYAVDRRYAAGTADATWAVNTNLIGSHIDILTSFLYARNPDVSVKKTPRVMPKGQQLDSSSDDDFAKTMELVISTLWKKARIKRSARKSVRSGLTTGAGWLKAVMVADDPNQPQMQDEQNDIRDNFARLKAAQECLANADVENLSQEDQDALAAEIQELFTSTTQRVEVMVRKYLAIDFCSSEDVQVSLDVREVGDYIDASWIANAIYRPIDELKELFPELAGKDEELKTAVKYYQRPVKKLDSINEVQAVEAPFGGADFSSDAEQYSTNASADGIAFAKVVELWDRRTDHVKTMIEGVKCWAKAPYEPPYPSSRFFPYFLVAFYEVDGARHPQSLPGRLFKLQDEYARSRSNFRLTRERATPGIIFNSAGMDEDQAKKIEQSTHQEYTGIKAADSDTPIQNLFAQKPIAGIDPRLYDNAPIITDMEKISGVQEALQTSTSVEKTATQANIEQTGFASRTTADRDQLETMLTDLANYTGEISVSALDTQDVQRIAGPGAFWPAGMDIDDLLTMVEIEITAGTTGKPKAMGDREAWGVILPVIKETIAQVQQARATGNEPLAQALIALLRETMVRMGDDTDVSRFIPDAPAVPVGPPGIPPGVPGAVPPAGSTGLPPAPAKAGGGAPPDLKNPVLENPSLHAPPPV